MLILATGRNSQFGKLKAVLQAEEEDTPLQQKLSILADQIGKVGMWSAGATFICMLGHILHDAYLTGNMQAALFRI